MANANLVREDSPSPSLLKATSGVRCSSENKADGGQIQKTTSLSPGGMNATNGSSFDRNHVRGVLAAFAQNGTTSSGVIVATAETSGATEGAGNKKTIEATPRKDIYASSSGANASANRRTTSTDSTRSGGQRNDEHGVWRRRANDGKVEKCSSQDSIIVQKQQPPPANGAEPFERSPSPDDDLVRSTFSNSSTSTVIKRFDNKKTAIVIEQRPSSDSGSMNDLPSYELASIYIKSNVYAQMSSSKGALNSNAASTAYQDKINHYDDSPTTPTKNLASVVAQQPRQSQLMRESSLEPIGEEERLVQISQAVTNSQSFRSKRAEILRYFAAAKIFQIRVVAGDIQITDSEGCPLFDAYQELDCRQRWWNIEAYGDRVLLMREELSFGDGSSSWGSRVTITDWNGELFGYLVTGDPMRLESAERTGLGRFFSQPAVVNNAACSNATSIPKACWICQVGADDGREQHVARLETYQRVVFLGDVGSGSQQLNFHSKLMALAGVVRLVGALTVTPVSDCLALTKFFCNCCAYK